MVLTPSVKCPSVLLDFTDNSIASHSHLEVLRDNVRDADLPESLAASALRTLSGSTFSAAAVLLRCSSVLLVLRSLQGYVLLSFCARSFCCRRLPLSPFVVGGF
jgi:hypothetical protein